MDETTTSTTLLLLQKSPNSDSDLRSIEKRSRTKLYLKRELKEKFKVRGSR